MNIQTIFDRAMLYDIGLTLQSGGAEVTKGLVAVNLAQDWLEMEAALIADVLQTHATLVTVADTETTAWPTDLLRLDALWRLDSNGRQVEELEPIDKPGRHTPSVAWPLNVLSLPHNPGAPVAYRAKGQGTSIYWSPTPDTVYTMRYYGLIAKANYTAAADTFLYPDSCALAIAPLVAKIFGIGLDREIGAVEAEARAAFRRVLMLMSDQTDEGPDSRQYAFCHDT